MANVSIKTKRKNISKKKKNIPNKKNNKKQNVGNTNNTVIPVSTPVGSVHFDEFLKICKEPKLLEIPIVKIVNNKKEKGKNKNKKSKTPKNRGKTKKGGKSKKGGKTKKGSKINSMKSKTLNVEKPTVTRPLNEIHPPLFPLIKALLLPTDDDPLKDNTLFSVSYKKTLFKNGQVKINLCS